LIDAAEKIDSHRMDFLFFIEAMRTRSLLFLDVNSGSVPRQMIKFLDFD
jgi:hypothetical protein